MEPCLCLSGDSSTPSFDCWICGGSGVILNPLHRRLIETNSLLHLSTAGAGPELLRRIWTETGISDYFVGSAMPYRRSETHAFLGHAPADGGYISEEVAYDMAMASYIRAAEAKVLEDLRGDPVGFGVTSAVASNRWPSGGHRAHMVVITRDRILHRRVDLTKGRGKEVRRGHDRDIAEAAQELLLLALDGHAPRELECETVALERFYRYPIFHTNGTRTASLPLEQKNNFLPATLDPIHDGHRLMAKEAEDLRSPSDGGRVKVVYLVSSVSPHKGKLDVQQMLQKAGMLLAERWRGEIDSRAVEFTRDEPLFIDKARKRPGSTFIIGADTMKRMLDPAWGIPLEPLLTEFTNLGVRFLVMGRYIDDKWVTCRDIALPRWTDQFLFTPLPGRIDVSSTQLRAQHADQSAA